jgi:serine/threonine protein kinase
MVIKNIIKNTNFEKAGNIVNSGSYGCVFHPSLECENFKASDKFVSKLMVYKDAIEEYQASIVLKRIFDIILPDYKKYIILSESICNITFIPKKDITGFEKCFLFEILHIRKEEVNIRLKDLIILNQRYGGIEFSYFKGSVAKVLSSFIEIIKKCIIVLNSHSVYHLDLKSSNILANKNKLVIIDWGNSSVNPTMENFRHHNRLIYNSPFGAVLFGEYFKSCYRIECVAPFIANHELTGHLKHIREIIYFFGLNPNCIEDYLTKIITTYTLEEYFKIFIHNVDLWGIVSCLSDLFMNDKYKDNPVFKKYGYKLFSYIYSDIGYLDSQKIISLFELFRRSLEYKSLKTGLKTVKSSKGSKRTLKKSVKL